MDKLCIEKNLLALSAKELYYCNLDDESFYRQNYDKVDNVAIDYTVTTIESGSVILIANEQNLGEIFQAEHENDYFGGRADDKQDGLPMLPFYLYYEEEQFVRFVQNNDISNLCRKYRVVVLVGRENFENFFCQLDVIYPTIILGDTDGMLSHELMEMQREKEKILGEITSELRKYYRINEADIKKRVQSGTAQTCILKYYYEPDRFKDYYRKFQEAWVKLGYRVEICSERGPVFRTHEILNVYQYRPDIVFQINKSRDGGTFQGEALHLESMNNLIFVNWLQDIYPEAWNAQYAQNLKEKDYIFSHFDSNALSRYGFSNQNMIYRGIMTADKRDFMIHSITEEEHARFDYDLCFFGSLWNEETSAKWTYQELSRVLSDEHLQRTLDVLIDMLNGLYDPDSQGYIVDLEELFQRVDLLQEEFQCDDIVKVRIFRVFLIMRYNTLRKLVMEQLASLKKYRIVLYGAIDAQIDGIDFGGFISDRKELSKAIQCCKICMQINPDMTINQRVSEALLSHTMVMTYRMDAIDDMGNIDQYLDEYEGICFFKTKKELFEKCDLLLNDKKMREEISERGYHKAKNIMTTDYIFGFLADELKKKQEL